MGEIERVLVIGAGTMGAGIAEVCIKANMDTILTDVSQGLVDKGVARVHGSLERAVQKGKLTEDERSRALKKLTTATDHSCAKEVDLVVEAIPEIIDLKKKIFSELSLVAPTAILASNTSSLSLTEIAASSSAPANVIGLHFFNPPPVMPLLEIVRAEQTSDEVVKAADRYARRIGKTPIIVRDFPGFATSRLGIVLGMEAIRMLETGVASAEDIDRAMELGYKHPMGPLKLTDLVGLDVRLAIAEHLARELGPQFSPPPLLRRLVRAGKLGKKTGEGFYRWNGDEALPVRH
jgi:3-hydroxybutyryl-CoA dehydrogenase